MLKTVHEFKDFYQDKENTLNYDRLRLNTLKKTVVRSLERYFFIHKMNSTEAILELGCGTGYITQVAAEYGKVTAIDLSEEMMLYAKERTYKNEVDFHQMSIFDVEKLDKKFDYVFSSRVLLHLDKSDVEKTLKVISIVLNKDGLFLFDLQRHSLFRKTLNIFQPKKVYNFPYTVDDIREIVENSPSLELHDVFPIDHSTILFPFYALLNKLRLESLRKFFFMLEKSISSFKFGFDRWGIVLKKVGE